MINYLASFTNTDGAAFPLTLGINASGAGAGDGTEFVKLYVDDDWGARQALLDAAGLTPDGVTETVDTSQLLDAIRKISGSPGEGVIWFKDDDPSVTGDRVLLLTGQTLLIANYIELDAAVYVGNTANPTASAFFRTSDAGGTIRNVAGPYIVVPDARGYALRGLDIAAAVDPDGASRDMCSIQLDASQGHLHTPANSDAQFVVNTNPTLSTWLQTLSTGHMNMNGGSTTSNPITDGANGTPRTDSESRMVNIACSFGIRY